MQSSFYHTDVNVVVLAATAVAPSAVEKGLVSYGSPPRNRFTTV